jgi:ATP-dependent Clp protease ATP-binding subunit ClpB
MAGIVDIQLLRLAKRLADRKIVLDFDKAAKAWLAEHGYDPIYGARPLKRTIQRNLENPLATMLLEDRIKDGQTVKVSAGKNGLIIDGQDIATEDLALRSTRRAPEAPSQALH